MRGRFNRLRNLSFVFVMEMPDFFLAIDPYLIWFYRLTGDAYLNFYLGTFALAFIALFLGEVTSSLAFLAIRQHIDRVTAEAENHQNLSMEALKAGDKEAYQAANKLANDAFGKAFFMQLALAATRLWPVPLALAWMQYRFFGIEIPLPFLPFSLGFVGIFIILYIAAYFLFKRVKYKLPFFRRIKEILDTYDERREAAKGLTEP